MSEEETTPQPGEATEVALPTVLIYCTDLYFGVQIQTMARKAGLKFVSLRPGVPIPAGDLMVVDLAARGDVYEAIREGAGHGIPVVAFGSHMDTESRSKAKQSGASRVLTNSNLARDLPLIFVELRDTGSA